MSPTTIREQAEVRAYGSYARVIRDAEQTGYRIP